MSLLDGLRFPLTLMPRHAGLCKGFRGCAMGISGPCTSFCWGCDAEIRRIMGFFAVSWVFDAEGHYCSWTTRTSWAGVKGLAVELVS